MNLSFAYETPWSLYKFYLNSHEYYKLKKKIKNSLAYNIVFVTYSSI